MEITHSLPLLSRPLLSRFSLLVDALLAAVWAYRNPRHNTAWGVIPPLDPTIVTRIWTRMRRAEAGIKSLMLRWRAGKLRPPARRAPASRPRRRSAPVLAPLPSRFGWLCPLMPAEAIARGHHIAVLLAEPEMQQLLAASPRARAILKPVCHMLAIDPGVLNPVGRSGQRFHVAPSDQVECPRRGISEAQSAVATLPQAGRPGPARATPATAPKNYRLRPS